MSNPRSHRPIQLLECLGKLVEKVVAKRLTFIVSRDGSLPPNQFGGVAGASCPDVALTVTHDVSEVLKRKQVATLVMADIKGFFDTINHNKLCNIMQKIGIP